MRVCVVKTCSYYAPTCILVCLCGPVKKSHYLWVMNTSIAVTWFAINWDWSFLILQTLLKQSVLWEKRRFWVISLYYYTNHSISLKFHVHFSKVEFPNLLLALPGVCNVWSTDFWFLSPMFSWRWIIAWALASHESSSSVIGVELPHSQKSFFC